MPIQQFPLYRQVLLSFFSIFFLLTGCSGFRYSKRQLLGANPSTDLAAAGLLPELLKMGSSNLSIRGVRLNDEEKRVLQLWGRPVTSSSQSSVWRNDKNEILAVVQWKVRRNSKLDKTGKRRVSVVRAVKQIDLFPAAIVWLHPKNRAILQEEFVLSELWRKTNLGAIGRERKEALRQSYCYQSGICLSQFNDLAPQSQRGKVLFSLYPVSSSF